MRKVIFCFCRKLKNFRVPFSKIKNKNKLEYNMCLIICLINSNIKNKNLKTIKPQDSPETGTPVKNFVRVKLSLGKL